MVQSREKEGDNAMDELKKRVRQLEIENLELKFQLSLLLEKNDISTEDMKIYAQKCLKNFPESENNSDIVLYLKGLIHGGSN